jgi:hypothetical protein
MTTKTRSRALRGAVVAGVMALLLGPGATAQAAVVPVNFNLTGGSLAIGAFFISLPAAGTLAGDWDDESGAFAGTLTIPNFTQEISAADSPVGLALSLDISIVATPVTGTVPPDETLGLATTSLTVTVGIASLEASCSIGPIVLDEVYTELVGGELIAEARGFTIPAVTESPDCAIASVITDALGLPTTSTILKLNGVLGDPPAAAEVVEAAPRFTG